MLVAREQTRNSLQKTHVVPGCTYIGIWDVVFFLYTKTYTVSKNKPGTISLKQTNKYDARDTYTYQEPCRVWRRTTSLLFCNRTSMGFAQLALRHIVWSVYCRYGCPLGCVRILDSHIVNCIRLRPLGYVRAHFRFIVLAERIILVYTGCSWTNKKFVGMSLFFVY